ncbi:hypothetical protein NFI96_002949 [Prochilodus magdalenae]|nr:hypothetical protein NFI96_002949 [Prochilodus magdalenae]
MLIRSGENDVEYSGNLDLEEGELPDDIMGATGGSSAGMRGLRRGGGASASLLEIDPVILIQLLDLKDRSHVESLWGMQPRPPASLLHNQAAAVPPRKDRERRPQAVRRSVPDSGVLTRLKAQMAEVRSKMSDVKGQLEARGVSDPRVAPLEHGPSADQEPAARRKPSELDLLFKTHGASRHGRHGGKKAVSPKQEVGGAVGGLSLRRSGEPGEKELRGGGGGDAVLDLNLCPREGPSTADSSVKSLSLHGPPVSLPGISCSSDKHCGPKPDESLYGASSADAFSLPTLNGAPPTGAKQRRTPSIGVGLLTDDSLDCEPEGPSEIRQSLLPLADLPANSRPDEGPLGQKQSPHLLAGMSSDSEAECETECENEDEAVALQGGDRQYDVLTCPGEQLMTDDLSFVTGESMERDQDVPEVCPDGGRVVRVGLLGRRPLGASVRTLLLFPGIIQLLLCCGVWPLERVEKAPPCLHLEHPHTVPADGAVGVEVEGHQVFWTCDHKPSILVLTTVPPHTDSLGVSTKTKAGLVTEDDPLPF